MTTSKWVVARDGVDGISVEGQRWYYVERGWSTDALAAWRFPTRADAEAIQQLVGGTVVEVVEVSP